jgi:hypothetical protein
VTERRDFGAGRATEAAPFLAGVALVRGQEAAAGGCGLRSGVCRPPSGQHPKDAVTATRILLDGLARDAAVFEIPGELAPCIRAATPSRARSSSGWAPTRWTGAGPARRTPWPWKGYASGSCPSARCAAGRSTSCSSQCWRWQRCTGSRAGPPRRGRLVADRRLLATRDVRSGRLHPHRRRPGGRAGAPGMPEPDPPDRPTDRLTPAHAHPAGLVERHNRAAGRPHSSAQIACICVQNRRHTQSQLAEHIGGIARRVDLPEW